MNPKQCCEIRKQTVPYLGHADTYFTGNSICGFSGFPDGTVTFSIGPDYTCPNYIQSEKIYVEINDQKHYPDFRMHRIRKSGVYFGEWQTSDMSFFLFDFAPPEKSFSCRMIYVSNTGSETQKVTIGAEIVPYLTEGILCGSRLFIGKDTDQFCFGNQETKNWETRTAIICFANPSQSEKQDDLFRLSEEVTVKGGSGSTAALYHHHIYGTEFDMPQHDADKELDTAFGFWEEWLSIGDYKEKIPDPYASHVVESLLVGVKMQQNRDGGSIAGIRKYANSYIRDTHGSMRLLHITGHTEETKKLILNIHSKWEIAGFIPNYWSMGSDSFIGRSFTNDASEITAYYICMIRDYLRVSRDCSIFETVKPSMKWAAEIQIEYLTGHNMMMNFNGDETEQYCCNKDGEEYGGFINPEYPYDKSMISFPSMAAALVSISFWDQWSGENHSVFLKTLQDNIDRIFWDEEKKQYHWAVAVSEDGTLRPHKGQLTNYNLLPLWLGVRLTDNREKSQALSCRRYLNSETGFLPNCPEAMQGFCGHTLGLMLYDMTMLRDPSKDAVLRTILHSGILGQYGTISEFYGPGGIPNGHNCRAFEGGIIGEAIVKYYLMENRI